MRHHPTFKASLRLTLFGATLISALACDKPRPEVAPLAAGSPAQPSVDLGDGGATVLRLLEQVGGATLDFPKSSLPEHAGEPGVFLLDDGWKRIEAGHRGRALWAVESPVRLSARRYSTNPIGMSLSADGKEMPYAPGLSVGVGPEGSWEVEGSVILIAGDVAPDRWASPPELHHLPTATAEARLNLQTSGLSPAEFVHMSVTLDRITRDALLLPAPGKATFQITVPPAGALRFGYAIAPPPAKANGGSAGFRVEVNGASLWTGQADVSQPWQEARVDLSAYAGQTVQLTLATEPDGDPTWDYAVFGTPEIVGAPSPEGPRRVVVIGIDTLRRDALGVHGATRDTSPALDALAAQSVVFENAYAPAPRTRPSFRTATTGRWPLPAINAPSIGQTLAELGYSTGAVVANVHLSPRMGFSDGFGWWEYENSAIAEDQVSRAQSWLERHKDEDSFLFLHIMDPHLFYMPPTPFLDLFTKGLKQGSIGDVYNRWIVLRNERKGALTEENRHFMRARYDGEVAYTDYQLSRFLASLDQLPGKTLLIVHADHGEEFWDHGSYEHNHSLYNELVHVPLWIRPPGGWSGGPHRVEAQVSLVDIAPTIYDAFGVPPEARPPLDGVSLLPFVDPRQADQTDALAARLDARPLQIGYLMYNTERWAVVTPEGKYILQTISGDEELYDLKRDPGEQNDLSKVRRAELPVWRERLSQATGWPVGVGWRVDLSDQAEPFEIVFEQPVIEAGVLDPEAARQRRANLEWGQRPPTLIEDVATVTLSEDRRTVRVTPGHKPTGVLYVLGPGPSASAEVIVGEDRSPLTQGVRGLGSSSARFSAGALIVPKDSEAAHLNLDFGHSDDDASIEALRELGYME